MINCCMGECRKDLVFIFKVTFFFFFPVYMLCLISNLIHPGQIHNCIFLLRGCSSVEIFFFFRYDDS